MLLFLPSDRCPAAAALLVAVLCPAAAHAAVVVGDTTFTYDVFASAGEDGVVVASEDPPETTVVLPFRLGADNLGGQPNTGASATTFVEDVIFLPGFELPATVNAFVSADLITTETAEGIRLLRDTRAFTQAPFVFDPSVAFDATAFIDAETPLTLTSDVRAEIYVGVEGGGPDAGTFAEITDADGNTLARRTRFGREEPTLVLGPGTYFARSRSALSGPGFGNGSDLRRTTAIRIDFTPVPEPATAAAVVLLGAGLLPRRPLRVG